MPFDRAQSVRLLPADRTMLQVLRSRTRSLPGRPAEASTGGGGVSLTVFAVFKRFLAADARTAENKQLFRHGVGFETVETVEKRCLQRPRGSRTVLPAENTSVPADKGSAARLSQFSGPKSLEESLRVPPSWDRSVAIWRAFSALESRSPTPPPLDSREGGSGVAPTAPTASRTLAMSRRPGMARKTSVAGLGMKRSCCRIAKCRLLFAADLFRAMALRDS